MGAQQPAWVAGLDSAEQHAEIEEWFSAVANRYPGIKQVEVVNEPLHQPPDNSHEGGYIGALGGTGKTGYDWIIEAFRMARAVFSDTTMLMINEYNIMNSTTNTDEYLKIIKLLQADTLIDAIGFQGHGFSHDATNATILRNIDTLASTGLPIYVTELDIDGLTDLQQVHGYMNLFPLFWEHPAIKGITLWGFRPGMWRTDQGAYLIDISGNERPAMTWLRAYLKGNFVPAESITVTTATGRSEIDSINGTLQMIATVSPDTATLQTIQWKVDDTDVATIDQNGLLTAKSEGAVTVTATPLELNSTVKGEKIIVVNGPESGVENITGAGNVKVYPNPAVGGSFTIEGLQSMSQVVILNLNGEQIYAVDLHNRFSVEIQLKVPAGVYVVRLTDGKGFYYSKIMVN